MNNLKPLAPKEDVKRRKTWPTLEERLQRLQQWIADCEIVRAATGSDPKKSSYEKNHGWSPHTIDRLIKDKERLEALRPNQAHDRHRLGTRPYHAVEAILIDLVEDIRSRQLPVDTILLRALAHDIYTILWNRMGFMPFPRPDFGSSWAEDFKKAWGLEYHRMQGEAGSVDMDAIAGEVDRVKAIAAEYPLDDIYNADETGLFLPTMSPWALDFDRQAGTKSVSVRVSILFCVNATGTDKRKPFVLSNTLPRGFKTCAGAHLRGQVDVLPWTSDQDTQDGWGSSWRKDDEDRTEKKSRMVRPDYMTAGAFLAWLKHTQHAIETETPGRRILLLVDNYRSHTAAMRSPQDFPNIRVETLPAYSTSVTQPLDAGIIAVFKRRYRHHVARCAYENSLLVDANADVGTTSRAVRVAMAKISNFEGWQLAAQAWSEITPRTIRDCFAHVPILNDDQREELRAGTGIDPDVQEAIMDTREDIADRASMMDRNPRMAVAMRFPDVFRPAASQSTETSSLTPVTHSNNIRDYYSRLSTLLDGSAFINDIIYQRMQEPDFMECFDMDPRTVSLDKLFANEDDTDDTDDDDYEDPIVDEDDLYASDSTDESLLEYEENGTWNEEISVDEGIDILNRAAQFLQDRKYNYLRRGLDDAAAEIVTPEVGLPDPGFVKNYNKRQIERMEKERQLEEEDTKIKEKYPQTQFTLRRLG